MNKVAFITCVNDEELYKTCLEYIEKLIIPSGFSIETIPIYQAVSMTSGYNTAMKQSKAKYKVYLQQDALIMNRNFISDVVDIFQNQPEVGIIGVAGIENLPVSADLREEKRVDKKYQEVQAVDGVIMITQYDMDWNEEIKGLYFFETSQCLNFLQRGYKVVVADQDSPWVWHDGERKTVDENGYNQSYERFVQLYDIHPLIGDSLYQNNEVNHVAKVFHQLYVYSDVWRRTYWLGTPVLKCPLDLWLYQEIISSLRPDVIIETGTFRGGSALFLASVCDAVNHGEIITIDIDGSIERPQHQRITYLLGDATSEPVVEKIRNKIGPHKKTLVILDSDHTKAHVLKELKTFSQFVNYGGYIIVEDTNINGNPVLPGWGLGPMEAVEEFLKENNDFLIDENKHKFFVTFNPKGYLKKIR